MARQKNKQKTITWVLMFLFTFVLGIFAIMGITNVGYAEKTGSLTVDGLTATESAASGTTKWELNGTSITGTATGKAATTGCNSTPASSATSTLALKNTKGQTAKLSFSYSVTLNSGTVLIDGQSKTSSGTYGPTDIANNEQITVVITSAEGASTTTVNITSLSLIVEAQITGTFLPASSGGTYTVNGNSVSSQTTVTQMSTAPFTLIASPASGYEFYGWHVHTSISGIDDVNVQSRESTFDLYRDAAFYVKPEFMRIGTAVFSVNGTLFNDLNKANNAASNASNKQIILAADGTLYEGSYTIASGVTLLIPFDAINTMYTTEPTFVNSYATPTKYRELTMVSGASITVNGAISVSSQVSNLGQYQGTPGAPTGPGGRINMLTGSTITINNKGNLYCWGFIYGDGLVEAKSGSTVYECFQMRNYRGGRQSSGLNGNSYKVFFFTLYFVQNIECTLKINSGASEKLSTGVYVSSSAYKASFDFIGSSAGLFRLNGGYITKKYDAATDMLKVDAYNTTLALSSISLSIGVSINSANYVLPITHNIEINLHQNTTVTTNQDLVFLPGTVMNIDEGSTFCIGNNKSVYLYDKDDWRTYGSQDFYPVQYTVANGYFKKSNTGSGTSWIRTQASLLDAEIDINGTIEVESGAHFYTTTGGAYIHSSGKTGKITFASKSNDSVIHYMSGHKDTTLSATIYYDGATADNSTQTPTTVVNAILTNGDGSHYAEDVVAGQTIEYDASKDKWGKGSVEETTIHVHFRDNENPSNSYDDSYVYPTETFTFPTQSEAGFTNVNEYKLRRWVNDDNEIYTPGFEFEGDLEDDITFYAYYGGWLTDSDNVTSYMYKTSDSTETYPYGKATVEEINGNGQETYLFEQNGVLSGDTKILFYSSQTYTGGDNKYYYFENGVLGRDAGVVYSGLTIIPEALYYIQDDGTALCDCVTYLSTNLNGLLAPGYYQIAADGKILTHNAPDHITDDLVYDSDNHLTLGYGLFCLSSENPKHFYYCRQDGSLVKNQTFYVTKTNGCWVKFGSQDAITIEEGLYYFDENGYMWYGNNILDENAPVEFGVIVTGNFSGTSVTIGGGN